MDTDAAILAPSALETPPAPEAEAARAQIKAQMAMLGRLAELGMDVAEAIGRQARGEVAEPASAPVFPDLGLAYSRVSRAVRMTMALQSRLMGDLDQLESRAPVRAAVAVAQARMARQGQVDRLETIVGRIASVDHQENDEGVERIVDEAVERLEDEDLYGDLMSRPFSEIVDHICRDLGLAPDWPRLAQEEAWALEELAGGKVGAPLAAFKAASREKPPPKPMKPPERWPRPAPS